MNRLKLGLFSLASGLMITGLAHAAVVVSNITSTQSGAGSIYAAGPPRRRR